MGSWNHTCALTLTPITSRDSVRLIVLCANPKGSANPGGLVHPTDHWQPISLAIPGTYDTYGRVAISTAGQAVYDQFRAIVDDHLVVVPSDRERGQADAPESIRFQKQIRNAQVFLKSTAYFLSEGQPGLQVGMMIVHEDAYAAFSSSYACYDEGTITPEGVVDEAAVFADALAFTFGANGPRFPHLDQLPDHDLFADLTQTYQGGLKCPGIRAGIPHVLPLIGRMLDTPERVAQGRDLLSTVAAFLLFHRNFGALRRVYAPTFSAGEDDNHDAYRTLADVTAAIIARQSTNDDA